MKVAQCVEVYIERKHACGFIYRAGAQILRRFARFAGDIHVSAITERHLELFLVRNTFSNNTWRRYVSHLGRFFVYWFAHKQLKQIPTARQKPANKTAFFPFIYTRSEIRRLLDAAAACQRSPRCLIDAETLRTILLVTYGTGMRINDVLNILDSDIDLERKIIQIRDHYAQLSRKIPIGEDVARILRQYLGRGSRLKLGRGKALFLTYYGKPIRYAVVGHAFQRLRRLAGVKRLNSSYQPRIHDLRHSFAVHSIASWEHAGLSVEKMLPILAAYMGNANVEGFGRYLELAPESYQRQLDQLKSAGSRRK